MKNLLIPMFVGVLLSCSNSKAENNLNTIDSNNSNNYIAVANIEKNGSEFKFADKIHKEFKVSANSFFAVFNISGSIKVAGYDGDKVIIDIERTISSQKKSEVEKAKGEFELGFDQINDSLIAYTSAPYDTRPHNGKRNQNCQINYNVDLTYTIKVPNSLNLEISTINDGDLEVTNVVGLIKANNINGKIDILNAQKVYEAHTINGDVTINYLSSPPNNAKFYTLNGELTVSFPENFSADCQYKSFQGELFTDFEDTETLTGKVDKFEEKRKGETITKYSKSNILRIGKGGPNISLETFNGDIFIKKARR